MMRLRKKTVLLGIWLVSCLMTSAHGGLSDDLIVRDQDIKITKSAQRPLVCGAVRAAQGIAASLEAAAETGLPGQVPYGSTVLSRYAFHYRYINHVSSARNVAVMEYLARDGIKRLIAIESDRWIGHAEKRLTDVLGLRGIESGMVTAIYSELAPCSNRCSKLLGTEFPKAAVTFSFEYGASATSRAAGRAALRLAVDRR